MKTETIGKLKTLAEELLAVLREAGDESDAMTLHVSNSFSEEYMNIVIYSTDSIQNGIDTTTLYDASDFPGIWEDWNENVNLIGEAVPDASSVE